MATDHEQRVLRDIFGINPDTVEMDWDSNLSWCVLQYGEIKDEYLWNLYSDDVDLDTGAIDELTYKRRRNKLDSKWDSDIEDLKTEAWESLEWSDG